jgi:uncharacterized membrane protein
MSVIQKKFFSEADEQKVIAAIQAAEKNTSGEIRVHLEPKCDGHPYERALEVFGKLAMHKTAQRNGVLFYLAIEEHKFTVFGDKGINEQVPYGFWDDVKNLMQAQFKAGAFAEGLAQGILKAGEQLKAHFPYRSGDRNELSDEISHG